MQFLTSVSLLLLIRLPSVLSQGNTISLADEPDYKAGRPCLQNCLYYIANRNGCSNIDECICRIDLQPQITKYISSCVADGCSYTADINSGVSIYQSYCNGKAATVDPVVTPVATQEVIETTVIDRQTVQVVATITQTNFATETVNDVSTLTQITRTITTRVPTSVTQLQYSTYTTVITGADSFRQTLDQWGFGTAKGLNTQGKAAIGLGVAAGAFLVAFIVALACCLRKRSDLKRLRGQTPSYGGNAGWGDSVRKET
ncbi:hypothetical protein ABW20_dc0109211 [Dactylellina cionopaga]|nr:hypothetical protein ABW20_dc0109211 [Dactylellina cionopaga]